MLKLFGMQGLELVHGSLRAENIFFKNSGVPDFKLIDFSKALFMDEMPQNGKAGNTEDLVALGKLLYELHFKQPVNMGDI